MVTRVRKVQLTLRPSRCPFSCSEVWILCWFLSGVYIQWQACRGWLYEPPKFFRGTFWDIWGQIWKIQKLFQWVTRISHSEILDILQPFRPFTSVPKFIHFRPVITFLQRSAFWDLADFWPIFRVSEHPKICAFISQKTKQATPTIFISPITFAVVSESGKISHLGGSTFGGYSAANTLPEAKIYFFFTFSRDFCGQKVRPSAPVPTLFCTSGGPLSIPPTDFGATP